MNQKPVNPHLFYNRVFDILVDECGANEKMREEFLNYHISVEPCDEFRFQGKLGYGGKYWRKDNYVTCYEEDKTTSRVMMLTIANEKLDRLTYKNQ